MPILISNIAIVYNVQQEVCAQASWPEKHRRPLLYSIHANNDYKWLQTGMT